MEVNRAPYFIEQENVHVLPNTSKQIERTSNTWKKIKQIILLCVIIVFIIVISIVLPLRLINKKTASSSSSSTNSMEISSTVIYSNLSNAFTAIYASELTYNSSTFYPIMSSRKHYYEALKITVPISGDYNFSSISDTDTYGYLFVNEFNPLMLCDNLIGENDDGNNDTLQFRIQSELQYGITYILVFTTYKSNTTGKVSIVMLGPAKVDFVRMNNVELSYVLIPLITPNQSVNGIYNTTAGGNSLTASPGKNPGNYPVTDIPNNACDGNVTTKYLSFGQCVSTIWNFQCGSNTGLYLTLQRGTSIAKGFQMCTAENDVARDPTIITLEGSNESGTALSLGTSWTLLYSGTSGLRVTPTRYTCSQIQCIRNSIEYASYRLLVVVKRASENSAQYSEFQLFGKQSLV